MEKRHRVAQRSAGWMPRMLWSARNLLTQKSVRHLRASPTSTSTSIYFQSVWLADKRSAQSSGGCPRSSIRWKTMYGSLLLPDARNVCSSLTHAKMMIRVFESNRKNKRNRRPIFARRQCRYAAPIVLPWRYSSRFGSLGTTSKINFDSAANSRTLALDSEPFGSCF